jgi:hypothetical protein
MESLHKTTGKSKGKNHKIFNSSGNANLHKNMRMQKIADEDVRASARKK